MVSICASKKNWFRKFCTLFKQGGLLNFSLCCLQQCKVIFKERFWGSYFAKFNSFHAENFSCWFAQLLTVPPYSFVFKPCVDTVSQLNLTADDHQSNLVEKCMPLRFFMWAYDVFVDYSEKKRPSTFFLGRS